MVRCVPERTTGYKFSAERQDMQKILLCKFLSVCILRGNFSFFVDEGTMPCFCNF